MEEEFNNATKQVEIPRQGGKKRAQTNFILNVQEFEEQQLKQLKQKQSQFYSHQNSQKTDTIENTDKKQQSQNGQNEEEKNLLENSDLVFANSQLSVKIPEFEALFAPEEQFNKEEIIQSVKERVAESIWLEQYNSVHELRQWNKFFPQKFCAEILDFVINEIMLSCENLRSTISRASLKLIREIFQLSPINSFSESSLQLMIVKIFEKANFDKHFLRKEANFAVECLEKNEASLHPEVIKNLCLLNFDKNAQLCEMACQSLSNILKQNRENLKQIKNWEVLNTLVKTLAKNLEGKRAKLKNTSKELCQFLNANLNESIFESLNSEEKKLVKSCLQEKKDNRSRNFKDFLKNNQSQLMTQKSISSNNNNTINNNINNDVQVDIVLQKSQSSNVNFTFGSQKNSDQNQQQDNQNNNTNMSNFSKLSQIQDQNKINNQNNNYNSNVCNNNNNENQYQFQVQSNKNSISSQSQFQNNQSNQLQNQNQNILPKNNINGNLDVISHKAQLGSNTLSQDSEFNSNCNIINNNKNYIYINNNNQNGNGLNQESNSKMQEDSIDII
ncbi:Armadillo-type fold [Pseudocohnilembus persalinus]|uniref:Armadillo-type fold n=1 Tax=Pseudocohnilembus persalinus TaxID=266149 RepID=A0A0V0R2S2_PSEPJ|nr:Armadillo-type fold [Pseudocohnilembus persalinus]|eukprot:KRX08701.1 Armadillo-type fold [Pseudocohnilembus persalinus]